MKRGLPRAVIKEGRYREVSLNDTFRFECKRCGRCCFTCHIMLSPFDILKLCEFLGMATRVFVQLYGHIHIGADSGLPICTLDFERVYSRRGGTGEIAPCPFLTVDSGRFACGVHPARPACCRSYPLFRTFRATETGETEALLAIQEIDCPAADGQEYTVAEWIEHEGLAEYQEAHDHWMVQVMALTQAKKDLPLEDVELLVNLWYNFSVCSPDLRRAYESAMEQARRFVEAFTEDGPGRATIQRGEENGA